jgi:hypothetical protein
LFKHGFGFQKAQLIFLGRNPASGGNLSFQTLVLLFLKSQEFLYIFFKRYFWILEGSTDF